MNSKKNVAGYFIGDKMYNLDELSKHQKLDNLKKFLKSDEASIDFNDDDIYDEASIDFNDDDIYDELPDPNDLTDLPDRSPIGIGNPLSIEIFCVYTGNPPNNLFRSKKDMLVVSGVKSISSHDESPRAINQLIRKVKDHQYFRPSAFNKGSPIIYYTPAVDVSTIFCSIEVVVDSFNESTFTKVSNLFTEAANIPLFFTSKSFLLAGSFIIDMFKDLGQAIFETDAFMKCDIPLYFDSPEMPIPTPRTIIVYNEDQKELFKDYKPGFTENGDNNRKVLIHRENNKEFDGDAPYILLGVDGRNRDQDLSSFTPKIATTSIIEKFYKSDIESKSTKILESAMLLYNDLSYYNKAKKLEKEIEDKNLNPLEYEKAQKLLSAYKANIQNEQFKF